MHRLLIGPLAAGLLVAATAGRADDAKPFNHEEAPAAGASIAPAASLTIPPVFEELFPIRVKKLHELAATHPTVYRRVLHRMQEVAQELRELKVTNLDEFTRRMDEMRLEGHAELLADKYRASKDVSERAAVEREMRATVEKLFDKKEEGQRLHLTRMEQEVAALKKKLELKHAKRDQAVDRRLGELKEEDEDLDF